MNFGYPGLQIIQLGSHRARIPAILNRSIDSQHASRSPSMAGAPVASVIPGAKQDVLPKPTGRAITEVVAVQSALVVCFPEHRVVSIQSTIVGQERRDHVDEVVPTSGR